MFKKEKGITLVALVVTIIILLILAGVSIYFATHGLVGKAEEAVNKVNASGNNENEVMDNYSNLINN